MSDLENAIADVNAKAAELSEEKLADLERTVKTTREELVIYQGAQVFAYSNGWISNDIAGFLYRVYGDEFPTVEKWDLLTIGERAVATVAAKELLEMKIVAQVVRRK